MKYVIKKSPDSTDSLSWWNCESRNWDIRSKATILSFHQGQYFVLDLHATRVGPNAFLVPADESPAPADNIPPPADNIPPPADNIPPPADNIPPPADKAASPTKDQTMRIDLGIQTHWPSGNCHGCGRHHEIPGVLGTDLTWPFLTLHLQAYTDKEKREEIAIQAAAVLCPDCSKAINNALEHNRWIINQVPDSSPPVDKAASPIAAPEVPSPAERMEKMAEFPAPIAWAPEVPPPIDEGAKTDTVEVRQNSGRTPLPTQLRMLASILKGKPGEKTCLQAADRIEELVHQLEPGLIERVGRLTDEVNENQLKYKEELDEGSLHDD